MFGAFRRVDPPVVSQQQLSRVRDAYGGFRPPIAGLSKSIISSTASAFNARVPVFREISRDSMEGHLRAR